MRLMSFALTTAQIRDQSKTVTRRNREGFPDWPVDAFVRMFREANRCSVLG